MNLGEIVTAVQVQFGDRGQTQILRADIVRWVNQAAIDIARKTYCVQEHAQSSAVANQNTYDLPVDFISMRRVTFDDRVLIETTLEDSDRDFPTRDTGSFSGSPLSFYIYDYRLYLLPTPQTAGTNNIDIWYTRYPVTLINDPDIPEIPTKYHELMVRYAFARATEQDENFSASQLLAKDYNDMIVEAKNEEYDLSSRTYPSVRLVAGDDWGYW